VALLDTGSVVSCISEEVWTKLTSTVIKPHILPVTSIHFRGAIRRRSCQVVIQYYLEIIIDENVYSVVALVVKNLIKPAILGADWLNEQRAVIDFDNNQVTVKGETGNQSFSFKKTVEVTPEPEDCVEELVGHIEICESPATNRVNGEHLESLSTFQAKVDLLKILETAKTKLIHLQVRV
jgi:hypothetical protein